MMQRHQCLAVLARHITDEIVVATYSSAFEWLELGERSLNYFSVGAMGLDSSHALGLALGRPDRRVICLQGDGSLLMNLGALATIAVLNPANLAILCVDNGHYGETGYQKSHTSLGVDLEKIAAGSGIKRTRTLASDAELAEGGRMLRDGNGTAFIVLKVKPDDPPPYKRNMDPASCRVRFRGALLGAG